MSGTSLTASPSIHLWISDWGHSQMPAGWDETRSHFTQNRVDDAKKAAACTPVECLFRAAQGVHSPRSPEQSWWPAAVVLEEQARHHLHPHCQPTVSEIPHLTIDPLCKRRHFEWAGLRWLDPFLRLHWASHLSVVCIDNSLSCTFKSLST